MVRFIPIALFVILLTIQGKTQNLTLPIGSKSSLLFDRWLIQYPDNNYHSAIQPYQRKDVLQMAMYIDSSVQNKSETTLKDLQYVIDENSEFYDDTLGIYPQTSSKPLLKYLYRTPPNFYEVIKDPFYIKINPILSLSYGKESGNDNNLFENSRGVELRAGIDKKVYVYTRLIESQVSYPVYLTERVERFKAVMGNGFYKAYSSKIFKVDQGYDFNNSMAYIGFDISRHIGLQFGYGKNFIGEGIRSMFLSDNSNNYLYLKLNTRFWKLHFQNIFGELNAGTANSDQGDVLVPKKYFAAHYLDYKIHRNWSIGLFETVVFSRKDYFDFQYFNPVILYRTVEGMIGSPDNILAGVSFKGNLFNTVRLYGQVMLDEFLFKELFIERRGWWANKFGIQGGIKYINAFKIQNLDIQGELNLVRPYTYSHSDSVANYSHYNQPLAHPLGANFIEAIGHITYRPSYSLQFQLWIHKYTQGLNVAGSNWGEDILAANALRIKDYGNELLQGRRIDVTRITAQAEWMFWHNMNLFAEFTIRNEETEVVRKSTIIRMGVRINFDERILLF